MAVPVLIGMVSCGQSVRGSDEGSAEIVTATDKKEVKNDEHGTIMLTKADFLTKVMNYEENPQEWKYLGEKPCLIKNRNWPRFSAYRVFRPSFTVPWKENPRWLQA